MHAIACEDEGEVKAFLRLTSGLLKPACDSIIVAIGLGLPLVVVVAGVPLSGELVVTNTPSSRLRVVAGIPLLGSEAVAVSGLLFVKGWGPFLRFLLVTNNASVRTWSAQSI